ncbi:SEC-C metal-binding domain-containing protein [Psychrobacillus sp. FSL K6-1267]|uniref:IS1096 element passenger TnpR family protein n=1 Tax=unclassified Psychrobacillus TaxID=2636677 RepID=UPI0030F7497A
MKAYILKLSFEHVDPKVWRRVVLPADATFNRLHETIQYVTNFRSMMEPYHSFAIETNDKYITNDEEIIQKYKGKKYEGKEVKQPIRIKIDKYLQEKGYLIYNYDFEDDWRILIELEEIVEDYYFGYPTILDGEGMAPPEDIGGPIGFSEFKKIMANPNHPDYLHMYGWAERQEFKPFDKDKLNELLKNVKYKKTEWEKIDHDNYLVLTDKYRGGESTILEHSENTEAILKYTAACINLYGIIDFSKFLDIYNSQNVKALTRNELLSFIDKSSEQLQNQFVTVNSDEFVHTSINSNDYEILKESSVGKPYYVPAKEELLRYADPNYYEETIYQEKLASMMQKDLFGGSTLMIKENMDQLIRDMRTVGSSINTVVQQFAVRHNIQDQEMFNEYVQAIAFVSVTTRLWGNRGHTPHEITLMEQPNLKAVPAAPESKQTDKKVGRNDPCPCGSGKKYKKCCGK